MEPDRTSLTRGYLDFSGLGKLRGQARQDDQAAMREAAQQFEAAFLQMMLKSMRDAGFKSDLLDSSSVEMYRDLMDREISVQMAKRRGFGIADMIEKDLVQQKNSRQPVASDVLKARASESENGLPLQVAPPGLRLHQGSSTPMRLREVETPHLQPLVPGATLK